jgi:tetratricopeptide (TPR) repeat protein
MEHNIVGAQGEEWSYSFMQRCLIAGRAVWFYAWKLVWPAKLIFMYDKWDISLPQQSWQILFGLAAIGASVALFAARGRVGRGPLVAVLFFLGTLFPALGFVNVFPMRYAFVADHFQYLASLGLIALVVAGVTCCVKLREARVGAAVLVLMVFCVLTFRQCRIYKDAYALWVDTIEHNPNSWMARNNLGTLYLVAGGSANEIAALEQFRIVRKMRPHHMESAMNIGIIAERRGDLDVARQYYQAAIDMCRHDPAHRPVCAEPFMHLGVLYTKLGRVDDAVAAYEKAIEWNPRHAPAMTNLGVIYANRKDLDKAIELYTHSLEIDPDSVSTRTNLANALLAQGNLPEAAAQWEEVQRIDPNNANIRNAIGGALLHVEQWDKAIDMFNEALRLDPNLDAAKKNLELAHRLKSQAATRPSTTRATIPASTLPGATRPATPR